MKFAASESDLVSQTSFKAKLGMDRKLLIGGVVIGIVLFSLVIALSVVASQKNQRNDCDYQQPSWTKGLVSDLRMLIQDLSPLKQAVPLTDACTTKPKQQTILQLPDCSELRNPTPRELANCVLDSYPLVDGLEYFRFI